MVSYVITGITTRGKRFRVITTNAIHANGINLWRGSVWLIRADGTRQLLKRVRN